MESIGLLKRIVFSERPPAVAYQITDFGKTALAVLETISCEEVSYSLHYTVEEQSVVMLGVANSAWRIPQLNDGIRRQEI